MTDGAAEIRPQVAAVWGEAAEARVSGPPRGWLDAPVLQEEVRRRQTGRVDVPWPEALVERLGVPRGGAWLSLGCGPALLEIECAGRGLFATLDAVDASGRALAVGRQVAKERGVTSIRFLPGEIDPPELPPAAYDVVLFNMSLHHVKELEATLEAVSGTLRPGGRLLANEYVGPSQFQFGEEQLGLVRSLLAALPERLRVDLTTGKPKTEYVRQPLEHWWSADPSEAVRSDEILDALGARFEVLFRSDYGGSILALALEHVVHNFREDDAEAATALRLCCLLDEVVTGRGVLPSDFCLLALARKGEGDAAPARPGAEDARPARHERERALRVVAQRDAELCRLEDELVRLRAERDATALGLRSANAELDAVRASRGWRVLEALRSLAGRRWGKGPADA